MTQILSQPSAMPQGFGALQNQTSPYQASTLVREQSASAYESVNAGLTIRTREGDMVTLSSSSFSRMESYMYNSQGTLVTESGQMTAKVSSREVTLTSGRQFAFTVQGDLNDRELEDIDNIIRGLDSILSEMVTGNMDDAVAKALSMGAYDSISEYSADLTVQQSYRMTSRTQAEMSGRSAPESPAAIPDLQESVKDVDPLSLIHKILEQLEKREEKLLEAARKPMDKLFDHFLKDLKNEQGTDNKILRAIEHAGDAVSREIDTRLSQAFSDALESET